MQITKEEDDMTITEFTKTVITWANKRAEPFTTYEVFNEIEEAEDHNLVSQTLSHMYRKGILARKKIDNVRFSYALMGNAPAGYESVLPETPKEKPTQVSAITAETEDKKPPKKQAAILSTANAGEINSLEVPDGFVLRLQTPGGLVITITTPGA